MGRRIVITGEALTMYVRKQKGNHISADNRENRDSLTIGTRDALDLPTAISLVRFCEGTIALLSGSENKWTSNKASAVCEQYVRQQEIGLFQRSEIGSV